MLYDKSSAPRQRPVVGILWPAYLKGRRQPCVRLVGDFELVLSLRVDIRVALACAIFLTAAYRDTIP